MVVTTVEASPARERERWCADDLIPWDVGPPEERERVRWWSPYALDVPEHSGSWRSFPSVPLGRAYIFREGWWSPHFWECAAPEFFRAVLRVV